MQTIEQINALPAAEIYARLDAMAPQVLAAREHFVALCAEQSSYLGARALHNAGLKIGDKVRVLLHDKQQTETAAVASTKGDTLVFQLLRKDGQPKGGLRGGWDFAGYEKL